MAGRGADPNKNSANFGVHNAGEVGGTNNNTDGKNFRTNAGASTDNILNNQGVNFYSGAVNLGLAVIPIAAAISGAATVLVAIAFSGNAAVSSSTTVGAVIDAAIGAAILGAAVVFVAVAIPSTVTVPVATIFADNAAVSSGTTIDTAVSGVAIFPITAIISGTTAILVAAFLNTVVVFGTIAVFFVAGFEARQLKIYRFNMFVSNANRK